MEEFQYCSWCFAKTTHWLTERRYLSRNEYLCEACGNYTVQCRYCKNMAKARLAIIPETSATDQVLENASETALTPQDPADSGLFWDKVKNIPKSLAESWNDELCAEHDGTVADFEQLDHQLDDLADFQCLFKRKATNLSKIGKLMAGAVGGAAVFCPLTYLAAPGIAAALGALGVLGSTASGTAISSLSGAALVNASLAAIGLGSVASGGLGMAGGMIIISAAGAALGGVQGAVVSNAYFGSIDGFNIQNIKSGTGPALIFINGFLSEKDQDATDWITGVSDRFPDNPCYYINWEAENLHKIGKFLGFGVAKTAADTLMKQMMQQGAKKLSLKLLPLGGAGLLFDLLDNPWHSAMIKAGMTGVLLADLLARTQTPDGFILMGNSLGCRVIYYALNALATRQTHCVKDVYLLGGAIGSDDTDSWRNALKSVQGRLHNCYSLQDDVLKYLYQAGVGWTSTPAGRSEILLDDPKVINHNVTSIVDGHLRYKLNLKSILEMAGVP